MEQDEGNNTNGGGMFVKVMTDEQMEVLRKQIAIYATICEQLVDLHKSLTSHHDLSGLSLFPCSKRVDSLFILIILRDYSSLIFMERIQDFDYYLKLFTRQIRSSIIFVATLHSLLPTSLNYDGVIFTS